MIESLTPAASLARIHPSRRPRILAVVHPRRPLASLWALARARSVARSRGADVHVLYVLSRRPGDGAHPLGRLAPVVDRLYGEASGRIGTRIVRIGHPTQAATDVAVRLGADLIVTGAERGHGGHWARVARRTRIPVLIARPRRSAGHFVAATDFSDERFPTFESAVSLAGETASSAHVLLLHNVDPRGIAFTRGFGLVLGSAALRKLRDARAATMHALAGRAPVDADAVLSGNDDPVSAIAAHAARRDADIVVVGAHESSTRMRGPHGRTANRVVERIDRSALIVPLPAVRLAAS